MSSRVRRPCRTPRENWSDRCVRCRRSRERLALLERAQASSVTSRTHTERVGRRSRHAKPRTDTRQGPQFCHGPAVGSSVSLRRSRMTTRPRISPARRWRVRSTCTSGPAERHRRHRDSDEAIAAADTLLLAVPNQFGVDDNARVIDSIEPAVTKPCPAGKVRGTRQMRSAVESGRADAAPSFISRKVTSCLERVESSR